MSSSSSRTTVSKAHAADPAKSGAVAPAQRSSGNSRLGNQATQRLLRMSVVQAKLTVNQPGDRFEQEADRVAEAVMRMPNPVATQTAAIGQQTQSSAIQRMCTKCEEEQLHRQPMEEEEEEMVQSRQVPGHTPEVPPTIQEDVSAIRGGGQPLPDLNRAFFESRFGVDFSRVRIHTDSKAAEAARAVKAKAFTLGQDITFARGEYAPDTLKGKHLLAHELTHIMQQKGPGSTSGEQPSQLQRAVGDEDLQSETPTAEPSLSTATNEPIIQDSPAISFRIFPPGGGIAPEQEEATIERKPSNEIDGFDSPEQEAAAETPYPTGMSGEALRSALKQGQPLEADVRSSMESRYGRSLDHVRIHNDGNAASLSDQFAARAFTYGNHIAFSKGAYAPKMVEGDRLLRHEVTHVLESKSSAQGVYRAGLCPTTCPPAGAPPFVAVSDSSFNCYSYALNSSGSGFLAPGQRAGTAEATSMAAVLSNRFATAAEKTAILPYFTVAGVKRNTEADIGSAISSDCTLCCSAPNRKIIEFATDSATSFARVVDSSGAFRGWAPMVSSTERWDFHWYRKDADRAWSHKHGGLDAQRSDESGTTPICNPCNANRNFGPNYKNVVGSWCF